MSIKDIVVYLDAGPFSDARLGAALALASEHGARIIGVDISTSAAFDGDTRERAQGLGEDFEAMAKAAGVVFDYRVAGPHASTAQDLHSHCADLLVATQPHADSAHLTLDVVPERILLTSGVPMLILPCQWVPRSIGRRVVVAWNASREATRALHDAVPILVKAEKTVLFGFDPNYEAKKAELLEIADHVRRHGATVEIEEWQDTGEIRVIDALFAGLDRSDADLIVAGAYGHSRWLEGLFGGASHDLILQETMPVLLSH